MSGSSGTVRNVVFDVGKVLIEWDPRHLYRKLLPDEAACEEFLAEVCTSAWNLEQDRGRNWAEAVAERVALFPQHAALIRAYDERWDEMVPGAVEGTPALLARLREAGVPLFAITNFSTEKFAVARARFSFLDSFRDTVVSGEVRLVKPDHAIYRLLLERNGLAAQESIFIDDSPKNVEAARALGMRAHLFEHAAGLEGELRGLGLLR